MDRVDGGQLLERESLQVMLSKQPAFERGQACDASGKRGLERPTVRAANLVELRITSHRLVMERVDRQRFASWGSRGSPARVLGRAQDADPKPGAQGSAPAELLEFGATAGSSNQQADQNALRLLIEIVGRVEHPLHHGLDQGPAKDVLGSRVSLQTRNREVEVLERKPLQALDAVPIPAMGDGGGEGAWVELDSGPADPRRCDRLAQQRLDRLHTDLGGVDLGREPFGECIEQAHQRVLCSDAVDSGWVSSA